jgi:hypothetical protein
VLRCPKTWGDLIYLQHKQPFVATPHRKTEVLERIVQTLVRQSGILMNPTALAIDGRLSIPATELLFFPKNFKNFRQLYFMVVVSYEFECPGATHKNGVSSKLIFAMLSRCTRLSVVLLFLTCAFSLQALV